MIKNKITKYLSAFILLAYMAVIFYLSSIPGPALEQVTHLTTFYMVWYLVVYTF